MKTISLGSVVGTGVLTAFVTFFPGQAAVGSNGNMKFYSLFASALNETCRIGFTSQSDEAREAKGYCMGFLYAVITKLEADGTACFGANISQPIEVAADLLGKSSKQATSWDVLQNGYKKEFPCP